MRPGGAPEVLQAFVTERGEGETPLGLYYSGNADYNVDTTGGGTDGDQPNGCGDTYDEVGDDCVVGAAVASSAQRARIIFDELLQGSSVEEFVCACQSTIETKNCAGGPISALDPSACKNNPDTAADESGRYLDENNDGMPDAARLIGGLVTFSCGGADIYTTGQDDGFYNPSGNQLIPVVTGLGGLGPALIVTAKSGLPSDTDCFIKVGSAIKDKSGVSVPEIPTTAKFHTEKLSVLKSTPEDTADGVEVDTAITISFSSKVDDATIAGIKLREQGPPAVDVTATVAIGADPATVKVTPAAALKNSLTYELVIPVTVTDSFGKAFPAEKILSFKTKAP